MRPIDDMELRLEWFDFSQHLRVIHEGVVLYNSRVRIVSPLLSDRQVKWITEHYEQKRKKYVF